MGYKIQYNPGNSAKYPTAASRHRWKPGYYVIAGTLAVGLLALLIHYRNNILNFLLPGDYSTTAAALQGLALDIRAGAPAGEAITTFCREIIEHAAQ